MAERYDTLEEALGASLSPSKGKTFNTLEEAQNYAWDLKEPSRGNLGQAAKEFSVGLLQSPSAISDIVTSLFLSDDRPSLSEDSLEYVRRRFNDKFGIGPADRGDISQKVIGRGAQAVGATVPMIPTIAASAGVYAPGAVIAELLGAGAAGSAGAAVEHYTGNENLGTAVEFATGVGAPAALSRRAANISREVVESSRPSAAREIAKRVNQVRSQFIERGIINKELPSTATDVQRAKQLLMNILPVDPTTGQPMTEAVAERLAQDALASSSDASRLDTLGAMGDLATPGRSITDRLLRDEQTHLSQRMAGRRIAADKDVTSRAQELVDPQIGIGRVTNQFDNAYAANLDAENLLWSKVNLKNLPKANVELLRDRVRGIVQQADELAGAIDVSDTPLFVKRIQNWYSAAEDGGLQLTPEMSGEEFFNFRQSLNRFIRDNLGPNGNKIHLRQAMTIRDATEDIFQDMLSRTPEVDAKRLNMAIDQSRVLRDIFDLERPSMAAMEYNSGDTIASRLLNASGRETDKVSRITPIQEYDRASMVMHMAPGGQEAVEEFNRHLVSKIVGTSDNLRNPSDALSDLYANEALMKHALGVDRYNGVVNFLKKANINSEAGNITPLDIVVKEDLKGIRSLLNSIRIGHSNLGKVAAVLHLMARDVPSEYARNRVFQEALADPNLGQVLLSLPDEKTIPAFKIAWGRLMARAGLRSSLSDGENGE